MITVYTTYIHPSAKEQVAEVLQTTMLSEGKKVKEFEDQLQTNWGIENPIALNSGTSALHLALVLAGVGPGDEVICPAQTFVASALVIVQQGARPVFADIQYDTGNIDPQSVRSRITPKTKAIMAVHWAGNPCDIDELSAIAQEFNIPLIEDAAHALGATYKGRTIGSIAEYTCFSFQAIKHVTTGDGGALAVKDKEKAREGFTRRWFGIDRANAQPSFLGERQYDISDYGFKYHLNDYGAALGLANLSDFKIRLERLRSFAAIYRKELQSVPGLTLWESPADRESACWLFGLHAERRNDFIKALAGRDVTASVVHQRIDRNSVFGGLDNSLEAQRRFDETQVHIPLHSNMVEQDVHYVIDTIKKGW